MARSVAVPYVGDREVMGGGSVAVSGVVFVDILGDGRGCDIDGQGIWGQVEGLVGRHKDQVVSAVIRVCLRFR